MIVLNPVGSADLRTALADVETKTPTSFLQGENFAVHGVGET